jgi:N-acyl-D-aspartate/D-glutamate deacylase
MRLDSRMNPFVASPTYQKLAGLAGDEIAAKLRDPELRERVLTEVDATRDRSPLTIFNDAYEFGAPAKYDPDPSTSIQAIAAQTGRSPFEVALDVLAKEDGHGVLYFPVMNYRDGNLDATREMLDHPYTVPGLGDAGAHCTLISDASFPTYLMTYWARDAAADDRFSIEWVVKRQCADTADLVGLHDRGRLVPGARGDVNVIDYDALDVGIPEMIRDLPAGGRRLVQKPTGYVATVCAGEVVHRDGEDTGARPGHLVRGPQAAPAG